MTVGLRRLVQVLFLAFFLGAVYAGKAQIWMVVFFAGVLGAVYFGRFYCGWFCPINTLMEWLDYIYKKLGIQRMKVPKWARKRLVGYGILAVFLGTMVFVLSTGRKLPVLPILAAVGIALSLVFVPALWHRYLCPYGTLLSITGSVAKHFWKVEKDNCIKCGLCKGVCPGDAITMDREENFPVIDKALCLECTQCVKVCPKNAIKYL